MSDTQPIVTRIRDAIQGIIFALRTMRKAKETLARADAVEDEFRIIARLTADDNVPGLDTAARTKLRLLAVRATRLSQGEYTEATHNLIDELRLFEQQLWAADSGPSVGGKMATDAIEQTQPVSPVDGAGQDDRVRIEGVFFWWHGRRVDGLTHLQLKLLGALCSGGKALPGVLISEVFRTVYDETLKKKQPEPKKLYQLRSRTQEALDCQDVPVKIVSESGCYRLEAIRSR